MDGVGVLLVFVIVGLAIYGTWSKQGSGSGSGSTPPTTTADQRVAAAKKLRSQALDATIAAHTRGEIDTATRDSQLGYLSRLPIDPNNPDRR
jgi:hypothetical protein